MSYNHAYVGHWVFLVWVGVLRPVGIWGHLQGENIQSYNLLYEWNEEETDHRETIPFSFR